MDMKRFSAFMAAMLAAATCALAGGKVTVTVKNPAAAVRPGGDMVEVRAADLAWDGAVPMVVTDEGGAVLPSQLTYDGKLVFPAPELRAKETRRFQIWQETDFLQANPDARAAVEQSRKGMVAGRCYEERQGDFSFENDRLAYRLYGPPTKARGERLYGFDIFNKRTSGMVLDELYAGQCDGEMWRVINRLNAMGRRDLGDDVYYVIGSYHVDHGKGMDCYKVGPTLGAGQCALVEDGKIVFPWTYEAVEVLDCGPLRLTVRLVYSAAGLQGMAVRDTRVLTVDAGSSMVRADVKLECRPEAGGQTGEWRPLERGDGALQWGAGIAVHKENPSGYVLNRQLGFVAYEDKGDSELYIKRFRERLNPEMGSCYIACLVPGATDCRFVPFEKEVASATGHVMALGELPTNGVATYYFGNAWSRNAALGINTLQAWQDYLAGFASQLRNSLQVKVRR